MQEQTTVERKGSAPHSWQEARRKEKEEKSEQIGRRKPHLQEQTTVERKGSAPHSWQEASSPSPPPTAPAMLRSTAPSSRSSLRAWRCRVTGEGRMRSG